jgi:DNA-binding NtrC family response regulator
MCISPSQALSRAELGCRPSQPRQAPKILILDPDQDSRQILASLLGANGYSTVEAADIDAARRCSPPSGFALVISEARGSHDHAALPVAVREELGMTEVPLIVHTSWLHADDELSAWVSRALAFIAKPYDHRALLRLIALIVGPGRATPNHGDQRGPAPLSSISRLEGIAC